LAFFILHENLLLNNETSYIEVRTANERGVQLYKKNGFKIEGCKEKAALIDGVFVNEFYIAKILSDQMGAV